MDFSDKSIYDYCDYCGQEVLVQANESGRILCDLCESHERDKADIYDNCNEQNSNLQEDDYITYLNIDEIMESVEECMDEKTKRSFEEFRSQDIDMCYAHKDILHICESIPEDANKKELNKAIEEIMDIALQNSMFWREE
jgi:uncharacterized Zn finger protein (UPF0148 family)